MTAIDEGPPDKERAALGGAAPEATQGKDDSGTYAPIEQNVKQHQNWRKAVKVHPAAELFPPMSEPELRELGKDIKKHGLREPIIVHNEGGEEWLLDGRNRLDAMELVGIPLTDKVGDRWTLTVARNNFARERLQLRKFDPYAYVISLNLHRRHLTAEQRRDIIAKLLKARPEQSNREIAKAVKADHKTVGTERTKLEATGEIPQLDQTVGADGKARPANKPPKAKPAPVAAAKARPPAQAPQAEPATPSNAAPEPPESTTADPFAAAERDYIEPHIKAAVLEYEKLPPRYRLMALAAMNGMSLNEHRKLRKDTIRLWAIENYKVDWLLKHFGVEVAWPKFDVWIGGCGDNNTSISTDGEPVIIAEEACLDPIDHNASAPAAVESTPQSSAVPVHHDTAENDMAKSAVADDPLTTLQSQYANLSDQAAASGWIMRRLGLGEEPEEDDKSGVAQFVRRFMAAPKPIQNKFRADLMARAAGEVGAR